MRQTAVGQSNKRLQHTIVLIVFIDSRVFKSLFFLEQ